MKAGWLLLVLLLAGAVPARAQGALPFHLAVGAYMTTAFVDVATTEYGLGRGTVREVNPLFVPIANKGPVVAGLAKGLVHTGVAALLLSDHKHHPKRAFWLAVALTGMQLTVDIHNARVMGR